MMGIRVSISIFLFLINFTAPIYTAAQCCAAGSPASVNPDLRPLKTGSVTMIASMRYSVSEAYFQNDTKLNIVPLVTESDYWFGQLQAAYTLNRRIEVNAGFGYFIKKAEHYKSNDFHTDNGYGLADLVLGTRFLLWRSIGSGRQLYGLLNITFPTGQFDLVRNGVTLPVQLQPSAGAFKYKTTLQYIEPLHEVKIDFFAQVDAELSSWINSDHFVYKYGNYYSMTLGAYHNLTTLFTFGLQVRGEWRDQSQRDNSVELEATGFRQISLCPLLSGRFNRTMNISFLPQVPIYRFYNGVQLANSWAGTFTLALKLK